MIWRLAIPRAQKLKMKHRKITYFRHHVSWTKIPDDMNKSFDYQIWKSVFIFYPLLAAKAKIAKKKNRCFFGRNCSQENLFWYYLTFTGLWKNYLVNVVLLPEKGYSCFSREADFFHLLSFSCVIFLAAVLRRASSRNQFPLARWLFHQVFMTWHDMTARPISGLPLNLKSYVESIG